VRAGVISSQLPLLLHCNGKGTTFALRFTNLRARNKKKFRGHLVIWSFGQNRFQVSKSSTIYKYLYLYIVSEMTESENENDHFDLDHFDHFFCLFLILVDSLLFFS
jgi:hypothetical protein